MRPLKTLALLLLSCTFALAAKPIFEVPEAGGFDRAYVTLGVINDGDKELKVEKSLCDGLTVLDSDGKSLPMTPCTDLPGPTLAAGEMRSTRFNLLHCFPGLATPGKYTVEWKNPVFEEAPQAASLRIMSEYAEIEIEGYGTLYISFYRDQCPKTVENFKTLVGKDFYKNLTFHRIIRGFMMQGGCPRGDGTGDPGYKFDDEPSTIPHTAGVLSMANSGKNTNGSQFFICFADAPFLNGKHTTFGKVMEGMDVVNKVEHDCRVPDQQTGRPVKPPVMKSVKWHEAK